MMPLRRLPKSRLALAGAAVFLLLCATINLHPQASFVHRFNLRDLSAGNATLGFQRILAVAPSSVPLKMRWRAEGLVKAANRTGLSIEIPSVLLPTDDEFKPFLGPKDGSHAVQMSRALAWLGHLSAIGEAANISTALILEDDVDWDISLRERMPEIASAIFNVSRRDQYDSRNPSPPYGHDWDLLWLGHCGDSIPPESFSFQDPIVPPYVDSWEEALSPDPHGLRWVHPSAGPICTFAYALTGQGAQKILGQVNDLRPGPIDDPFDIWLHLSCKDRRLRCYTVNPEIFHHHQRAGKMDSLINGQSEEVLEKDRTPNIWHSARCNWNIFEEPYIECMR